MNSLGQVQVFDKEEVKSLINQLLQQISGMESQQQGLAQQQQQQSSSNNKYMAPEQVVAKFAELLSTQEEKKQRTTANMAQQKQKANNAATTTAARFSEQDVMKLFTRIWAKWLTQRYKSAFAWNQLLDEMIILTK